MANTLQIRMTTTIIDELGVEAECTTYALVDPTVALVGILTTFYVWLDAVDNVTAGKITRANLVIYPGLSGLKDEPAVGSRTSQSAVLNFTGPSSPRRDGVLVPALADALISAGKIVVGTGAVADLITFCEDGGVSLEPSTSDWDAPLVFKDSLISFRNYNEQLSPLTFNLA